MQQELPPLNGETTRTSSKPYEAPLLGLLNIMNSLTHLVLGAIACSAFIFAQSRIWSTHFTQHIYLCVSGYVLLMGVAIMSFDPNTSWSRHLKYQEKRTSHLILQVVGSILAISGSIIRIVNINNNFQSAHGILGLIAMIMTILSLVGGIVNLFLSRNNNRVLIKTVHSCFGSLTVAVAFIGLCLGFNNTFRFFMGNAAANMCISLTVFALCGILLPPTLNTINRIFN